MTLAYPLVPNRIAAKSTMHQHHHAREGSRDMRDKLRQAGLRPTRQRLALAQLLFGEGNRHTTAEMLYQEASSARIPVSLATIYNTLHQLTAAGLLREVAVDGAKTYFCTNVTLHHHFYMEDIHKLEDIPGEQVVLEKLPTPPEGYEISRVDLVVRLRRKKS